jgi:hypothetical protein
MEKDYTDDIQKALGQNYDHFFDDFDDSVVDTEKLGQLNQHIKRRKELLDTKESLELDLKKINEELLDIETRKIPEEMDNAGIAEFTTHDGLKVSVKPFVSAIPAHTKDIAYDWFDQNGLGDIIKRTVSLQFDKSQGETARMAEEQLQSLGFDPKTKLDIHYQTFQATIKELHDKGIMPPLHEWGVYFGRKAQVKAK